MECAVHKLVADVSVLTGEQVLLVRYVDTHNYDGQRGWFLPDDYLQFAEHPDAAAARILQEQVGFTAPRAVLDHIESFAGDKTAWHLIFHYKTVLPNIPRVTAGRNVAAAQWFSLDALPASAELAHEGWAREVLHHITASP